MRSTWVFLLLVILLLVGVRPLLAADQPKMTPEEVRAKCAEIDTKCAAALSMVEDLQSLKASLLNQIGEGAPPPPKKSSWAEKISVSGYFQNRYETFSKDEGTPGNEDRFGMRRLYVNLIAKTSARSSAVLTFGSDGPDIKATKAAWMNVFCDYSLGKRDTVRFGQGPSWFGLEIWQSSSVRLPFERSAVVEGGSRGKPAGVFSGGPYDRGLWWIHTPTPQDSRWMPQAIVSVVNGSFRNEPVNNDRTLAVDLKWRPSWGMYGVSWLNGEFSQPLDPGTGKGAFVPTLGAGPFARDVWLGYARYERPKVFALQSEYAAGVLNMRTIRGWYAQAELPFKSVPGTAFAKYEWYNPNTEADDSDSIYRAWILGYAHQLDNNNRLTAQGTWGRVGEKDLNESGLSWQYSF